MSTENVSENMNGSGRLSVGPGKGGLTCVKLYNEKSPASAYVYLFGGHVTSWVDGFGRSRIFTSESALFNGKKAIRGGIPVCFPQFGKLGPLAQHGFGRVSFWEINGNGSDSSSSVWVELILKSNDETKKLWNHDFILKLKVTLDAGTDKSPGSLDCKLTVENPGDSDFDFTGALHAYFNVASVKAAKVLALKGRNYRDHLDNNTIKPEEEDVVTFQGEVDRVYIDTVSTITLESGSETFPDTIITKENFPEAVVWNPYIEKSKGMADLEDTAWEHYVCIEPAIGVDPVKVAAGGSWTGSLLMQ